MHDLQGRKKGGGRAAIESADTLRSVQVAEVAILVSEGECQGLVNGLKSVYLDGVAVENADGSRNFENVEFAYTVGTQGQAALPGLASTQAEVGVALQIDQSSPVTRTIPSAAFDHIRITLGVPQLTQQDSATGDLAGSSFEFAIDVQSNGAGFVERHRGTVEGKTTSRYTRAIRVPLTGPAPWDVRVRRITADPATVATANRFFWDSYTLISSVKLRYPNSAISYLRVNAQNFGRVPVQALDWLGVKMKVPSNYDPITRVYTGTWDGIFKVEWTNNPAWVFNLFLTHERFGLGRFISAATPNKWALYKIAQYCDELVPDGRGGFEPRFQINCYIQTRSEAYTLLRELAAVFRAMSFWTAGTIDFAQDAPGAAELLYTAANVVDGDFTYADTSERQQHSVFVVQWSDLSQFGKLVPEVYADRELVQQHGMRELQLTAFGCTSRGQAARVARWAAFSEQFEGEVVSFTVGADGMLVRPGRIFKIIDAAETGERLGGRIKAATDSAVELDAPVDLAVGEAYSLSVLQPLAGSSNDFAAEKRTVVTGSGSAIVLTVVPPFSAAPTPHTIWLLESTSLEPTWWRVLQVQELAGKNQWSISAVRHHPGKYALIEQGLKLDQRPISRLSLQPKRPASIAVLETPYLVGSSTRSRVTISWPEPGRGLTYLVSWRLSLGPWTDMPATSANSVEIDGLARGVLDISVRSVNAFGNGSTPTTHQVVLLGKLARPGNVQGFTAALAEGGVTFKWQPDTAPDYLIHELREGPSWAAGVVRFEGAVSEWTWVWPPLGVHQIWIKSFDTSLGESQDAIGVSVEVTDAVYAQWSTLAGRPADAQILKNLLNPAVWVPGSSGSQAGFTANPTSATGSNAITYSPLPDGSVGPLWRALSGTANDGAEGGWTTGLIPIDAAQMYRFRVWVRLAAGNGSGNIYLGCAPLSVWPIPGAGADGNPYFVAHTRAVFPADEWCLMVGYVFGAGFSGASPLRGGVWRSSDGQKLFAAADFKWAPGQLSSTHRAFQYYTNQAGSQVDFYDPRIELCDGTEAPVDQLLAGAAGRNASAALVNAATAQGAANTANAQHADMASDAKLTPLEKQVAKLSMDAATGEKSGIDARGAEFDITTELAAYDAAYAALAAYVLPLVADLSVTSDIVGADYRATWAAYYLARQSLLNRFAVVAAQRAVWAQVADVNVTTTQLAPGAAARVETFFDAAGFTVNLTG